MSRVNETTRRCAPGFWAGRPTSTMRTGHEPPPVNAFKFLRGEVAVGESDAEVVDGGAVDLEPEPSQARGAEENVSTEARVAERTPRRRL